MPGVVGSRFVESESTKDRDGQPEEEEKHESSKKTTHENGERARGLTHLPRRIAPALSLTGLKICNRTRGHPHTRRLLLHIHSRDILGHRTLVSLVPSLRFYLDLRKNALPFAFHALYGGSSKRFAPSR